MDNDRLATLFQQAISADAGERSNLLATLSAPERLELEALLDADQQASEGHLFESLASGDPAATQAPPEKIRDYELRELIGEGGMGTVYKAFHSRLQRHVALKLLPQLQQLHRPDTIARFHREMAAVGRLRHPNIVEATDAGDEDGVHFLALEYVDGPDVSRISKEMGQLEIRDACEIVRQTASGLHHAHEKNIVHRDIKPSNLLVSSDGKVKIADMGLALLQVESDLTTDGQVMGTVNYIAPEQIENAKSVDARTDLYSLGCTFYQLLSGRAPFDLPAYDGVLPKLHAHSTQEPVPIAELRPDVPAEVAEIVTRLLAKQPQDRFATAAELVKAITPHAHGAHIAKLVRRAGGITEAEYSTDRIVAREIDTSVVGNRTPRAGKSREGSKVTGSASGRVAAAKNPTKRKVIVALLCAIGLLFTMNAPQLMRIATNKGVLVIENQDGVDVLITRGKKDPVTIRDKATDREYTLDVGDDYQLVIKEPKTDTEFTSKSFSIKRNQKTVFDARVEMANAVNNTAPVAADRLAGISMADLTPREILVQLLRHGAKRVSAVDDAGNRFAATSSEEIPPDLQRPRDVSVDFDILRKDSTCVEDGMKLAERLDLGTVTIYGRWPPRVAALDSLSRATVENIVFQSPFDFRVLAELPAGAFAQTERLSMRKPIPNEGFRIIFDRFPHVNSLTIRHVDIDGSVEMTALPQRFIGYASELRSAAHPIEQLTNVKLLRATFDVDRGSEPLADFSHLPPDIEELETYNVTLTQQHLDQLERYQRLKSIKQRYAGWFTRTTNQLTSDEVAEFARARSNVTLDLQKPGEVPLTNANAAAPDAGPLTVAPSKPRQPANRETASLSDRQLLEWLLLNGTKWIKAFDDDGNQFIAHKPDEIPRFLEDPKKVEIAFDILDQQPPPIPKLVSHASRLDLDVIQLFGEAPSAEVIASIAEVTKLSNVRFYGKFNFDNLAALPAGAFQHARILLFREDLADAAIPLIASHFSDIEVLNITNANLERFSDLSKLGSLRNIALGYLTGTPTQDLAQLPAVEDLFLGFSYALKTSPAVDLSHLPPNLRKLEIRNLTLTAKNFEQLKSYRQLASVDMTYVDLVRKPSPLDQKALADFRQARPDVSLNLDSGIAPVSAADIPKSETANLSQRQLAQWLLRHGVSRMEGNRGNTRVNIDSGTSPDLSEDLSEILGLNLCVEPSDEDPTRIESVLAHASGLKNLETLMVFGDTPPSLSALKAIAAEKKLDQTRFFGGFDFQKLAAMPEGSFAHVEQLLFRQPITDEVIRLINSRYPKLERLNITRLRSDRIWELQELPLKHLVLGDALKGTPTQGIEQLTEIETLYLNFFTWMKTEPEVDLSHLPPNTKELVVYNLTLTEDHLADLKWYKQLKLVQQRYSPGFIRKTTPMDAKALADFKRIRPDVRFVLNPPPE